MDKILYLFITENKDHLIRITTVIDHENLLYEKSTLFYLHCRNLKYSQINWISVRTNNELR